MPRSSTGPARHLPLSPRMFHLLLALAEGPHNGYQASQRAEDNSGGRIQLSPATLYENLHRLQRWGLIARVPAPASESSNGRRQRFYELTEPGRLVLEAELDRLRVALQAADAHEGAGES